MPRRFNSFAISRLLPQPDSWISENDLAKLARPPICGLTNRGDRSDVAFSSETERLTGIDFSKFDFDQPLPELTTNGHQSALAKLIGKTPRSIVQSYASKDGVDFTGTSDHVAGLMQDIMEEVGGDGFPLFNSEFDRRYIMEVCDGLVPELQGRGLTRKASKHKHFKDNLLEF